MSMVYSGDTIQDTDGGVLRPISSVMRNRIINGAMVIDQRNAGASVTPTSSTYTLDRWRAFISQSSKFSIQQVDITGLDGFNKAILITSLSAYSVVASDNFTLQQRVEGFNIIDLGWGTANAKTITLSFFVKSSLTGTFGGSLRNSDGDRSYPFTYTISSANTWEQKSITITGDTTGTWNTSNLTGIALDLGLGVGTDKSGTTGVWASANYVSATGATSVVGTSGATFYITGVQLEVGTQATSFEYRQYGTELQLCQRYYYKAYTTNIGTLGLGWVVSATVAVGFTQFPVPLRIRPTALEQSGTATDYDIAFAASAITCSAVPTYSSSTNETFAQTNFAAASGLVAGNTAGCRARNTNAFLAWSAEL